MRNLAAAIATLGPVGMLPAPGTAGSFAALIMAAVITHQAGIGGLVVALVVVVLLAFPRSMPITAKQASRMPGRW